MQKKTVTKEDGDRIQPPLSTQQTYRDTTQVGLWRSVQNSSPDTNILTFEETLAFQNTLVKTS